MEPLPVHIFRAYDVRGLAPDEITSAVAQRIGRAYGRLLDERFDLRRVVVGRDNRPTSPALHAALIDGVRAAGLDAIDIGEAPSPLLYYAAADWGAGGVSVTASHNPPGYNGFKLLERAGIPLSPGEIQEVRARADQDVRPAHGSTRWGGLRKRDPRASYLALLEQRFPLPRPLRIAVDPGNGVATLTGPPALRRIGARVTSINSESNGGCPAHPLDPAHPESIAALRAHLLAEHADIGFGWDGDGDRLSVVDEQGTHHNADAVLAVLARDLLRRRPGARILVDVKMSLTAIDTIEAAGGSVCMGPTGHSLIKRRMRDSREAPPADRPAFLLGGEGTGHFYFGEDYFGLDDAVYAACALARIVAGSGGPASALFQDLPAYVTSPEFMIPCPDARKHAIADAIGAHFRPHHPVLTVDGARVDFGEGWAVIRASNTSPTLSVRLEARSAAAYAGIRQAVLVALRPHPELESPEAALTVVPNGGPVGRG